jgi:hypothetical protein
LPAGAPAPVFKWTMSGLNPGERYVVVLDGQRGAVQGFVLNEAGTYDYDGATQWPALKSGQHTWQVIIVGSAVAGGNDIYAGPTWTFAIEELVRGQNSPAPTATPSPSCPTGQFWDPVMNRCKGNGGGSPSTREPH